MVNDNSVAGLKTGNVLVNIVLKYTVLVAVALGDDDFASHLFGVVDLYARVVESTTNDRGQSSVEVVGSQIIHVYSDVVFFGFRSASAHGTSTCTVGTKFSFTR